MFLFERFFLIKSFNIFSIMLERFQFKYFFFIYNKLCLELKLMV